MRHFNLKKGLHFGPNYVALWQIDTMASNFSTIYSELFYIYFLGIYKNSISKWRFETWNEPDLKMYNTMKFNVSGEVCFTKCLGSKK